MCGPKRSSPDRLTAKTLTIVFVFLASLAPGCGDDGVSNPPGCGDGVCSAGETRQSCPEDCGHCGNGVAEPELGEECDGEDMNGKTCLDLDCDPTGRLLCNEDCLFDTNECGPCSAFCGNGVIDNGDECDCGLDEDNLPAGCTAINGEPGSGCTSSCKTSTCLYGLWDERGCEADGDPGQCCQDDWGNPATCLSFNETDAYCVLICDTTNDCHFNNFCVQSSNACLPYLCGAKGYGDVLHEECVVPGGGSGYCMPLGLASWERGLCYEYGTIPTQGECTPHEPEVNFPRDAGIQICNNGFCADTDGDGVYHCVRFCHGEAVYDDPYNENPCGEGYNCFSESLIDPEQPDPDLRGMRWADTSYCRPTAQTDPVGGVTTCDLITGELIMDRTRTCAHLDPALSCTILAPDSSEGQPATWGTLIGGCFDTGAADTSLAVWDPCDENVDACPSGSICAEEDLFQGQPAGVTRCIPICDTQAQIPCVEAHVNLPVENVCTSVSVFFRPGAQAGTSEDPMPTRLGLCALPPVVQ